MSAKKSIAHTTKDNRVGLKPKQRKLVKTKANQWSNTPQQHKFMELWINPRSETFGNAYQSAVQAGYSPHYANQIASPAVHNEWIQAYKRKLLLGEEHLKRLLSDLAINAPDSRSPDDTRVKAIETLARIEGLIDKGNKVSVTVVQPILGGESVRKHIDSTPV